MHSANPFLVLEAVRGSHGTHFAAFRGLTGGYTEWMTLTACLELSLRATPSSVREARVAVGDTVAELVSDERVVDDVRLCVSEAVTNVVRHAYGTKRGAVEVLVEREGDELVVAVRDEGMGLTASRRRGKPGGFGLKIIDKVASRHTIESAPKTGTEIRMVFDLESPQPPDSAHS